MSDSIDRAKSALTWPATQSIERLKAASFDLRQRLLAIGRDIVLYSVAADTTLASVLAQLPDTKLTDLIKLNPSLVAGPVVSAGTVVRYYAAKISP